ncbi:transcriptional regulator [Bombella sp. ESL0387]|nr:transcriptional regulator [Bombella sp. ESL0387]
MDREDIKAALRKTYGSLSAISVNLGLHKCAVSATISKRGYSVKNELRIAKLLGKRPYEVWGAERFNPDDSPVREERDFKPVPAHLRKQVAA